MLKKVLEHLSVLDLDEKTVKSIGRLLGIWKERVVFDPKVFSIDFCCFGDRGKVGNIRLYECGIHSQVDRDLLIQSKETLTENGFITP